MDEAFNSSAASRDWSLPRRLFYAAGMVAAPPLHIARLAGSVAPRPKLWGGFLGALPVIVPLYVHMSVHEAFGYLLGPGSSAEDFAEMELSLQRR